MLFAGQTRVRQRTIILVAGAHWPLLANAIETSVCGGDAAFCQIHSLLLSSLGRITLCGKPQTRLYIL